jgi:hypothetical protein
MQQRQDWYAHLGLSPDATTEQIEQAVERLSQQAASLAVTAPERSQLLRETVSSIKRDLLSGPESRQRYDAGPAQQPDAPIPVSPAPAFTGENVSSRISRFLRTGWTCSSCGKDALPSDKFCTRCGTPIKPVQPGTSRSRTRLVCANCAAPLAVRDAFCAKCGTPVPK